jgi:hypothetical protein
MHVRIELAVSSVVVQNESDRIQCRVQRIFSLKAQFVLFVSIPFKLDMRFFMDFILKGTGEHSCGTQVT